MKSAAPAPAQKPVAAPAPVKPAAPAQALANSTIPVNKISNKLAKEIESSLKFLDDDVYVAKPTNWTWPIGASLHIPTIV